MYCRFSAFTHAPGKFSATCTAPAVHLLLFNFTKPSDRQSMLNFCCVFQPAIQIKRPILYSLT